MAAGTCELCGRHDVEITRHHLIPRTRHSNKGNRRLFGREEVRTRLAVLCPACHGFIHEVLTEKQMEREYNTIEALRTHPEISKFAAWVGKRPPGLKVHSRRPAL